LVERFQVSLGHARESVRAPGGFDTPALVASWQAYRASVPWQIVRQQFNALGTHDTPRIRALLQNDMGKLRLAVTLLMTVPGVPCIFTAMKLAWRAAKTLNAARLFRGMPWNKKTSCIVIWRSLIHWRKRAAHAAAGQLWTRFG